MTRSFHVSRLAEIDEAAPVEPVSFPGRVEINLLRRTLKRWQDALGRKTTSVAPVVKPPGRSR
ncbi:MAG: hypothetical protein EOP35_04780 [Rubrivivax sp.]|nr:MAG: hypothetical protein EOP35_04780 [Rubrivivax sp.]